MSRRVIALEPDQPRYRILVVDDRWDNRQLLVKLLKPLGFALREAENGQEAVEIWAEWQPHLIWMDLRMPVMDGYEATKRIKATPQGRHTAIIAVTASSFEEEQAVVLSADCDDFLRKPFHETDIFEKMHKHIGVRYVYEEPGVGDQEPGIGEASSIEDLKSEIRNLPPELLVKLEQVAIRLDMGMVDSLIDEVRPHNTAVADALAALAADFRYDEIAALIQEAKENKNE